MYFSLGWDVFQFRLRYVSVKVEINFS